MSGSIQRRPISPAGWARVASGGKWVCPPHLALLNREVMELSIRRQGGLLVELPPRHGKSMYVSRYLPGWWLGTFPDEQVILTSYEADFAASWGRAARLAFEEHGPTVFGQEVDPDHSANADWGIKGRDGSMRTAGVGGPITGKGAHLLVADDLIKNAEEAASETNREKVWEWWQSTAYTRIEPGGVAIMMFTRWHEDDPVGRMKALIAEGMLPGWKCITLPALAEEGDLLGRQPGAALWDERYTREKLLEIKAAIGSYFFSALYQQNPVPRDGGNFKREWFERKRITLGAVPPDVECVRFWDLAASEGRGDWTAGFLEGRDPRGAYYLIDCKRARKSPGSRDRWMRAVAEGDRERWKKYRVRAQRDPGQAGVSAALEFCRNFDGFNVATSPNTGDKETNAEPLASQAEAGNVFMVEGEWNDDFLREIEGFPNGTHDDQCLVAGTLVATDRGDIPIEDVRAGMMALTRKGYRRVLWSGATAESAPVVRVEFADGTSLSGTANHPVYTPGVGWSRLDSCTGAFKIASCENTGVQRPSRLSLTRASSMPATRSRPTATCGCTSGARPIARAGAARVFTARCGWTHTARSPMGTTSTIGTTTLSTTRSTTWSASLTPSTSVGMPTRESGARQPCGRTWTASVRVLPSGIGQRKGGRGTASMARRRWPLVRFWTSPARPAEIRSSRSTRTPDRVPAPAARSCGPPDGQTAPRPPARSAARNSGSRVALAPLSAALGPVGCGTATVFNLAVEGEHEFFANGILVHNCDAASGAFNELANNTKRPGTVAVGGKRSPYGSAFGSR
jgi:predicted phage terminase large subunit-like protein